jgi:hypothetical protein
VAVGKGSNANGGGLAVNGGTTNSGCSVADGSRCI